jgi:hypothetical protein
LKSTTIWGLVRSGLVTARKQNLFLDRPCFNTDL